MHALQFKFNSHSYMAVCDDLQYVSNKPALFRTKKEANAAESRWGFRGCWKLIEVK